MKKQPTSKIKIRIKDLECEVQAHQQRLAQLQRALNETQTLIVSKNGALIELRRLAGNGNS